MTTEQFIHRIRPLWRALADAEGLALEIHLAGDHNAQALQIVQITRDARSKFSVEEKELLDRVLQEVDKTS